MTNKSKVITISKPVDSRTFLHAINGILKLTKQEIEVLSAANSIGVKYAFTTQGKKELVKLSGLTSIDSLNNYMVTLRKKGMLIPDGEVYKLHELVVFDPEMEFVAIKFKNDKK